LVLILVGGPGPVDCSTRDKLDEMPIVKYKNLQRDIMKKTVYALIADSINDDPIIFYVGCTNDLARRSAEHRRNAFNTEHAEYNTNKYKFIRDLINQNSDFRLAPIAEDVNDDENTEYEYVLMIARHNESHGHKFYNMPLTNMRRGDFLSEMMRDKTVNTAAEIKTWRAGYTERKRKINYESDQTNVLQGRDHRRNVANSMVMITQQKRTEDVLAELQAKQRRENRERKLAELRQQQRADWEQTGQLLNSKERK
jgi:hypothetical protein